MPDPATITIGLKKLSAYIFDNTHLGVDGKPSATVSLDSLRQISSACEAAMVPAMAAVPASMPAAPTIIITKKIRGLIRQGLNPDTVSGWLLNNGYSEIERVAVVDQYAPRGMKVPVRQNFTGISTESSYYRARKKLTNKQFAIKC